MATLRRSKNQTRSPRRDAPLARTTVFRGMVIFVVLGAASFLALSLYNGVPTTDYEKQFVSVPNVGNLLRHDAVRIGGSRVGQVYAIDLGEDGRPRAELQLNPGTKLPKDTTVTLRANGLLGARYIELNPGKSKEMLPFGSTIKGGLESYTLGLPEAVTTFDEPTRKAIGDVIDDLSTGLAGLGDDLNGFNRVSPVGARNFDKVARAVLARDGAAARLIPSLDSGVRALENPKELAKPFLDNAAQGLRPFVTERQATRDTIAQAPAALSSVTDGLTRGRELLVSVRELAAGAAQTLPSAPPAFADLAALMGAAPPVLERAIPTLRDSLPIGADAARRTVLGLTRPGLVPALEKALPLLQEPLDVLSTHGCDITNFAAALRSMTGFGQAGTGPNGAAMAFRLEVALRPGLDTFGLKAPEGTFPRRAYQPDCTYPSRPYPQFTNDPAGTLTPGNPASER